MQQKSSPSQLRLFGGLAVLALGTLAACKASTAPKTGYSMKLSVGTSATSVALASLSAGALHSLTFGPAGEIVITKAQIVLDQIELSPAVGLTCNGTGENECDELDHAAMIIDLPVTAGLNTALTVTVAAGTYAALDAELQASEQSIAGHPEFDGRSVRVEGTYNGTPFIFTSNAHANFEMSFKPPVVVTTTSRNITINIDISKWFLTAGGAAIDPATANAGGANEALVKANIRASFSAFDDDNESGVENSK